MVNVLLVGVGGMLGAIARYCVGTWVGGRNFPYGTLTVNLVGCFFIGLILGLAETHTSINHHARLLLVTGVLGGFTTFSAFGFDTYTLLREDRIGAAIANVGVQVIVGLLAVWAGHALSKAFN